MGKKISGNSTSPPLPHLMIRRRPKRSDDVADTAIEGANAIARGEQQGEGRRKRETKVAGSERHKVHDYDVASALFTDLAACRQRHRARGCSERHQEKASVARRGPAHFAEYRAFSQIDAYEYSDDPQHVAGDIRLWCPLLRRRKPLLNIGRYPVARAVRAVARHRSGALSASAQALSLDSRNVRVTAAPVRSGLAL